MKQQLINWCLFIALSIIWGSSFLLMKIGLETLKAYQVAAMRIFSAGLVMLPFLVKSLKGIAPQQRLFVVLSGILGSFFPAFLFCIAETQISSALTGMLNSLTPLFTIVIGVLFFKLPVTVQKWVGVIIGLVGLIALLLPNGKVDIANLGYASLVLLATAFYAVNVNMVGKTLKGVPSVAIASVAFSSLIIPSGFILWQTGYFNLPVTANGYWQSSLASAVLGIVGTAFASILFYRLLKSAGALFASMVTYGIPFVAVGWGLVYGESISFLQ
ncbi:MAG: DMT family transporter, partial [Chitinophagaceae bacterium]